MSSWVEYISCSEADRICPNLSEDDFRRTLLSQSEVTYEVSGFYTKLITVKLGNKERFDKEQIGIKELFMDYQPFYTINILLDKELLPI